jgi:uncharacterized protein involved in outer membrane biogenesis
VVKRVRLIGGNILLEIDKAGLGNWLFRRGDPAALALAEADRPGPPPTVESVSIEDSVVTFHDGQTGVSQQMKIAAMTATTRGIAVPVRIDLAAQPTACRWSSPGPSAPRPASRWSRSISSNRWPA